MHFSSGAIGTPYIIKFCLFTMPTPKNVCLSIDGSMAAEHGGYLENMIALWLQDYEFLFI